MDTSERFLSYKSGKGFSLSLQSNGCTQVVDLCYVLCGHMCQMFYFALFSIVQHDATCMFCYK